MIGATQAMKDPGGYITEQDVNKMIDACENERDKLLLQVLAHTGRRITEVLMLTPGDIVPGNSGIMFTILKKRFVGDRPKRQKYVHPDLCLALIGYSQRQNIGNSDRIFPFTRMTAFNIVRKSATKAGVTTVSHRPVHPHHFRHFFVVDKIKHAVKLEEALQLRDYMEHSSIVITESYLHTDTERQKNIFKRENDDRNNG